MVISSEFCLRQHRTDDYRGNAPHLKCMTISTLSDKNMCQSATDELMNYVLLWHLRIKQRFLVYYWWALNRLSTLSYGSFMIQDDRFLLNLSFSVFSCQLCCIISCLSHLRYYDLKKFEPQTIFMDFNGLKMSIGWLRFDFGPGFLSGK